MNQQATKFSPGGHPGGRGKFKGPVVKAKDRKGTLKRIWMYMKKEKLSLLFAIVLVILTTLLGLVGPYMIGIVIDEYIIPKNISGTIKMVMILAVVYIVFSILTWFQSYLMINISLKTIRKLRQDLFNQLQSLSLRFFDKKSQGELMSRVTNDIDQLNNALSQSVIQIMSAILTVAGVLIAMLSLNWLMAIITLCVIPVMIFSTKRIIKYSSRNFIKRQRDLGELNGIIEESITGLEVIQLFGKEEKVYSKFSTVNEQLRLSSTKADIVSGFLGPVNNFINNLGLVFIIASGALLTLNDLASVGIIAAFVTYSRQFFRPINQMSSLLNTFQAAIAGAERAFEILDEVPEVREQEKAIPVKTFKGDVQFSHVSFGYVKEKIILKEISLHAKAGQTIAIVGPTGSGKTTMINLLARFYDVDAGSVMIDGRNIKEYRLKDLRRNIGLVLQDTFLFSGTIMENIRYGNLKATDEEVIRAAKTASAHRFIKHLPKKYETLLSSGGNNLSQGQKQLIAIARAILADSSILILDEATSSIDTKTEIEIQTGLVNLMSGRTSFVIAHRLKTIENADVILVIQNGEIIERGTHEELLSQKGFYYESYRNQFEVI
ncbi:ABC transporter ATP-binding protein [Robertmurraya massiliosenegalensis]|uniref:ABC transporter ATP-binding protein n=1 Tax=Robertmurraya massiliosenegalensis TaxID=1287657 RepID=UPI00030C62AC